MSLKSQGMKYVLGLLILLFVPKSFAQGEFLDWGFKFGVEHNENIYDSAIDDLNNIYLIGEFSGNIEYYPAQDSFYVNYEPYDVISLIVYKYTSEGDLVWAKEVGGDYVTSGSNITVDPFGNLYLTGTFRDTVDFDPGPNVFEMTSTGSNSDVFYSKWDSDGNFIWARHMDGYGIIYVEELATDSEGSLYSTGDCKKRIDFDPDTAVEYYINSNNDNSYNLFVYKLDSAGNFAYAKKIGGDWSQLGYDLEVDEDKNVYLAGYFYKTTDFDPGPGEYNLSAGEDINAFIAKLDSLGEFVWAKQLESTSDAYCKGIELDGQGNIYSIGAFRDTIDLDPSDSIYQITGNGNYNGFVSKMDTAGNFIWGRSMVSVDRMFNRYLALGPDGSAFIAGWITDTTNFDLSQDSILYVPNGSGDIFLTKVNPNGDIEWIKQNDGNRIELCYTLAVDGEGSIYLTGLFQDSLDLDPDIVNSQIVVAGVYNDNFLQKFRSCNSYFNQTIVACNEYVSPGGSMVWTNGGIYTDTIQNSFGCDSIITTNLSIVPINNSISQIDTSLYNDNGAATYQWLDCSDNYSPISGDTNAIFSPTENGTYAVEISLNGCVDTSVCQAIWNVSLLENELSDFVSVYPNPFNGPILIDLNQQYSHVQLIISNQLGQQLLSKEFVDTDHILTFIDLKKGIYSLEVIIDRKERSFHKIIKY